MSCAAASQQSFHIGLIIPVHPSVKNSKSEVLYSQKTGYFTANVQPL